MTFRRWKAFHGICPPIFSQTWLPQYGRGAFFYSAHCSFSNHICFWSVWCRRTMIPGKIFTSFAKFQVIVSVNDFRLPIRLQELLQALLCFLRSFCLHGYDWIHWVAKSCTTIAYRWLCRDSQLSLRNLWSAVSANTSSARGPRDLGPLADLAISVFREVSINTVFTQIHTSRRL